MLGGSQDRRANLYRQLGALESAGIPFRTAIDRILDPAVKPVPPALDEGCTPGEAWARSPAFSRLEVALVRAGTKGGQLVESFHALELLFEEQARARRAFAVGLAYPIILVHLLALIPTLPLLVQQGLFGYLRGSLVPLAILYAGLFGGVWLFGLARRAAPGVVDGLVAAIPVVGSMMTKQALCHGLQAFTALYRAGVSVEEALEGAHDAATLEPVRVAFARIRDRTRAGETLGDAWFKEESLPQDLREAAATGALTGKLEESLAASQRGLASEADAQKKILLIALPILAFLGVALAIGITVVSSFVEMTNKFNEALK